MMWNMPNRQNNSMTASHFYVTSAATRNSKHLHYQVICSTCLIFTYKSPAWFRSVPSGISVLLPLALTQSRCSDASIAFPLQECEGGEIAPAGRFYPLLLISHAPQVKLFSPGDKTGSSPTARLDKEKLKGLVTGERLSFHSGSQNPLSTCTKDLSII